MFKIDQSPTYFFPAEVETPEDGGIFKKSTFDAEFKRLSRPDIRAIWDRLPMVNTVNPITDDELLDQVFVGWKGIADEGGAPLPYSETAREKLLLIQGVAKAIIKAFFASVEGAKTKN